MKKYYLLVVITLVSLLMTNCTDNEKARSYGGKETLDLPKGQKLIMVTWKETDLWYLTRPMNNTDVAETYTFQKKSSFGVWEGTITVIESK